MAKVRGVDVSVRLVADLQRGVDAEQRARVVEGKQEAPRPRVDIATEVETGFEGGGRTGRDTLAKTPTQHGAPVAPGGGVLGFLMAKEAEAAPPLVADPASTQLSELARFVGLDVKVTVYDPEEYPSLEAANRRGDSLDSAGVLKHADDDKLVLTGQDGRERELDPSLWTVARVEVSRGPYAWRQDASMTVEGVSDALLPGAPIQVKRSGGAPLDGAFVGTGRDPQGLYLELVDQAGLKQRVRAADVYDVTSPGFAFTALTRD